MNGPSPVVVSFYTLDSPYEQEVLHLMQSCEDFGLNSHIEGVSSFGSWELNCAHKPTFLISTLKLLQKPLLWVDADAVFKQRPDFTHYDLCDFAVRINTEFPEDHPERVYSGTLFINNTQPALTLLEQWKKECENRRFISPIFLKSLERDTFFWDQIALNRVILENKQARVNSLPKSYCKIFDKDEHIEPIIEHWQASRRFKELM